MVEEDTTDDSETGHTTEVVGYLALEGSGTLRGRALASTVTKYYHANGKRVAMRRDDVVYYLHGDHLGSVSLVTSQTSNVIARRLYDPYGETRWSEGTLPTDYQFTGQRHETDLGLYDYNARYYDPYLGRFISADTIVPEPGNPQDLNRYAYTRNNPLAYTDPSGHFVLTAIALAAGVGLIADWSVQVHHNMQQGQTFWEAAYHRNLDEGEMLAAGAIGGASGAMVAGGLPLVAAGGSEAVVGAMGVQGGISMASSEAGYLAGSAVTGQDTSTSELVGVSTVGGAAGALNAPFPAPGPSALIQGAAGVLQYEITSDHPSSEGRIAAGAWGAFSGVSSAVVSQELTKASAFNVYDEPCVMQTFSSPETAKTVAAFRMADAGVIAGADFTQSFGVTVLPLILKRVK